MNELTTATRLFRTCLSVAVLLLLVTSPARALITGGYDEPVEDAGWPEGALDVANLASRVGWWEGPPFGGGRYQFLYRGKTDAFEACLNTFASITAPELRLVLHDGPHEAFWLKSDHRRGRELGDEADKKNAKPDARVDWTFTVWRPESFHRLNNNPKSVFGADQPSFRGTVDPPQIDLYIGGGGAQVDWKRIKVPKNVTVIDERAEAAGVKPVGGAMVRCDVFDMSTGKPVKTARLVVTKTDARQPEKRVEVASAKANGQGRAEATKIPAGTYQFVVEAEGYASRAVGYAELNEKSFKPLVVELAKQANLSGVVTDDSGKPVAGATVRATCLAINGRGYALTDGAESVTGEDGRFIFQGLPIGYAELYCTAEGYFHPDWINKLHDVPTAEPLGGWGGTGAAPEPLRIVLQRTGSLRITVTGTDPAFGGEYITHIEPEGGNRVGSWGGSGTVPPNGVVEHADVPPGKYVVRVRPNPGRESADADAQTVEVKPGETAEVNIEAPKE